MLFSRFVSFVAFTVALGGVAVASPVVEKRDAASIEDIVSDLQSQVDSIVPQITDLAQNDQASEDTLIPLLDQLINSFSNATTSLAQNSARSIPGELVKRQNVFDVAQSYSEILTSVTDALSPIVNGPAATTIPSLGNRLLLLDSSSSGLLDGLDSLLPGLLSTVLGLVGTLLPTILGLLGSGGGLGGLLGILGILGL